MYKNFLLHNLIFKEARKSILFRLGFLLVGLAHIEGYIIIFLRRSLSADIMEGY